MTIMTATKLSELLTSDRPLTLTEVKQILYELKEDIFLATATLSDSIEDVRSQRYYMGEINAFYIALDLLAKVPEDFGTHHDGYNIQMSLFDEEVNKND